MEPSDPNNNEKAYNGDQPVGPNTPNIAPNAAPPSNAAPAAATKESVPADNTDEINTKPANSNVPNGMSLTVEELYDKDKHDLSTMEPGDVFQLLQ